MGWYAREVVPRVVTLVCATRGLHSWRTRVCQGLSGAVVEIGFGAGLNLPFYPTAVERIYAVEPSDTSIRAAGRRVERVPFPVQRVGLDGQSLPLDDESCDHALITFTLCTVPDAARTLTEVHRVLAPGGTIHILEHGLSPDPRVARWQSRLDPFEQIVAGGCHLTREPLALLRDAGFEIEWSVERYLLAPTPWSYLTAAVARRT